MSNRKWIALAAVLLALVGTPAQSAITTFGYRVVHTYPHDPQAFTEGLFYQDGYLYESTGLNGRSSIRKVSLRSGSVVRQRALDPRYFGEGIVAWGDRLIQLTWQSGEGFVYDLATFRAEGQFRYAGEGWALTRDDHHILMSDGTPFIRLLDPATLQETGRVKVTRNGVPLANLNELEWVRGRLLANIWQTNTIVQIDPASGEVVGEIDLTGLLDRTRVRSGSEDVLNGIAYDARHDRLFVTGKNWPSLFEIRLVPMKAAP